MIIDYHKCYGGGGSGSGVTPQEVQAQIDSALTPYWDSAATESAITEAISGISLDGYYTSAQTDEKIASAVTPVANRLEEVEQVTASALTELRGDILEISGSSVDLSAYYTSAQTEEAISAATSGKADAANVSGNTSDRYFPAWNEQGIITGITDTVPVRTGYLGINGTGFTIYSRNISLGNIYGPQSAGTAGDILVSAGKGAPVWSAVTFPDVSNYVTSAQVETQIEAKNYVNSGDVKSQVEAYNYATVSQIPTVPTSNTAFTNDAGYITDAAIENLVTSAQVETQIDTKAAAYTPTSGFSTINGSAITNGGNIVIEGGADMSAYYTSTQTDAAIAQAVSGLATEQYVQDALSGVNMDNYYTSAQTEEAISAATAGKADKANILPNYGTLKFPAWSADGIIVGEVAKAYASSNFYLNGTKREPIFGRLTDAETRIDIYTPLSAGTAGDILVSTGSGAPVWSAVTMPEVKTVVDFDHTTQAERAAVYAELKALYDGGSGATINKNYDFYKTVNTWQGQKIDYYTFSGDTLVFGQVVSPENLEDQVAYVQVMEIDSAGNVTVQTNTIGAADMSGYYTSAQTDEKIAQAVSGLATEQYVQDALSGVNMDNYYTSAQTEDAITSKNYITSAQVETQIVSKNYITSAEIADFVTSAQVETQITSKGYATVSQIPTVPTSNTAFTNDAGYVTSAQVETQILEKNYITSAATANMVSSTYVSTIWKGTQAEYDAIVDKDPNTFYIIVSN